jgi:3-hydroxyisobutyrate dehydrogenase
MPSIAVLGTGVMGAPIARHLAAAGNEVHVYNRSGEKAQALRDQVAEVHEDPAAASRGRDVVVTMLADADTVLDVIGRAGLAEGQVWWQCSTIGLEGTERCAALAAEADATLVDAPVLGTKQPAEDGKLVVLASGPDPALDALAPLFAAIGPKTIRAGEAGAGQRLKLAANAWVLAVTQATAETVALVHGLGLELDLLVEALDGGPLDLPYFRLKSQLMVDGAFPPAFALDLAAKDARLVGEAADRHDIDIPLARAVAARFAEASEAGYGDEDMAAVYRLSR